MWTWPWRGLSGLDTLALNEGLEGLWQNLSVDFAEASEDSPLVKVPCSPVLVWKTGVHQGKVGTSFGMENVAPFLFQIIITLKFQGCQAKIWEEEQQPLLGAKAHSR